MLGAIVGDIIGSVYERRWIKTKDFPLFDPECVFTDDTVLTVAVADCVMHNRDYTDTFHRYFNRYPWSGYGMMFIQWAARKERNPYNSFGNGSAMRVSPVGFAYRTLDDVLEQARRSAEVTHNHPEGIKGAQATAAAVFMARKGHHKTDIKRYIETTFAYDLNRHINDIRPEYRFDATCQGSVPESIIAFLDSTDYEDAVRNAVSLGGDADTMACIAGGIAQAYYGGVPEEIAKQARALLDDDLRFMVDKFMEKFGLQ